MTPGDCLLSFWWRLKAALRLPGAHIRVETEEETLRAILERRASIARFGDGELMGMLGYGIYFQEYHPVLARRMREIIRQPSERFFVALPPFDTMSITKASWKKAWARYRLLFSYLVRKDAKYYSTAISRPGSVGNFTAEAYYQSMSRLWENRDVVLVHNTPATAQHPLFRNARSVQHVACPPEHAFREYDDLLARASAHLGSPDVLYLVAAGPTACLLVWDLAQRGAQALDVGHLTSAYDEFAQKR